MKSVSFPESVGVGGAGGGDASERGDRAPGPVRAPLARSSSHVAVLAERAEVRQLACCNSARGAAADAACAVALQADAFTEWVSQWPAIQAQLDDFTTKLKRRQLRSQNAIAEQTGTILRNMVRRKSALLTTHRASPDRRLRRVLFYQVGTCRINSVGDCLDRVRQMGKLLIAAQPLGEWARWPPAA